MTFDNSLLQSVGQSGTEMSTAVSSNQTLGGAMSANLTSDRPYPHVGQIAMMWILPFLMILLNILVFIVTPRMKSIRPCTGYGMMSLAAADFCLGIVHIIRMSYNTYSDYQLQAHHPICILDGYGQALFASISICTLTFMNIDRLLTIAFPLHYPRHLSSFRVISVHSCIWVFMICLLAPTTTGITGTTIKYYDHAFMCVPDWAGSLPYNIVVLILVEIIPTGVILICFIGIFYFARSKSQELKGKSNAVQVHHGGVKDNNEDSQWKRDMRIFRTLAIMTFGFYVAWSPYFITVAIPEMITGRSLHPITDFITPWLGASNSFWNPLIYIPTMRPFYKAMVVLYKKYFRSSCSKCCRWSNDNVDGRSGTAFSSSNSGGTASTGVANSAMEQNAV